MSDEMGTPNNVPPSEEPAGVPAPPAGYPAGVVPPPVPVMQAPRKTDPLYFILGFVSAILMMPVTALLLGAVFNLVNDVTGILALVFQVLLLVIVVGVFLWFLIAGKRRDNLKMRSFGKGGLWAAVTVPLLLLLAVGSCIVLVGQSGL